METLTAKQAFEAMSVFLDTFYDRTQSDEIGGLLGDLQIVGDGMPADPAAWQDWMKLVDSEPLTVNQAFEAMKLFLKNYYERIHAPDKDGLLASLGVLDQNQPPDPAMWQDWLNSIHNVLNQ